ncbi:hypothetical protein [Pseudomonas synxantha]|uniref:hypothetical protein n=1 Tax=Pseudomonas synxantha TaxID=47883 RepID=UPI000F589AC3|nr:hypothetical protein [Pseudomonas synxantha]
MDAWIDWFCNRTTADAVPILYANRINRLDLNSISWACSLQVWHFEGSAICTTDALLREVGLQLAMPQKYLPTIKKPADDMTKPALAVNMLADRRSVGFLRLRQY